MYSWCVFDKMINICDERCVGVNVYMDKVIIFTNAFKLKFGKTMKSLKQLLLSGIIISVTVLNSYGQQGTECGNPLSGASGSNQFTGVKNQEVWYAYEATQSGKIILSSCLGTSDDDTQVKVYSRRDICEPETLPLYLKAESDDHCGVQSKVAFLATEGYEYLIVWTNKSSSNGFTWTLYEEDWQQGEICSNPKQAIPSVGNICDHGNGTDQWFAYTAPGNGTITVSSCTHTSLDTRVDIYSSCSLDSYDFSDNHCGTQSELSVDCISGTEYLIQWKNVDAAGSYNWSLVFDGVATGVERVDEMAISIAPNPTKGLLELSFDSDKDIKVDLVSLSGAHLKTYYVSESNRDIDISEFPKGIYLLTMNIENKQQVFKVVKR